MLTQDKLQGLAFPLIKVRFIGPGMNSRGGVINSSDERIEQGARWTASYMLDRNRYRRITRPYNDAIESGAQNALPVAQELWERILKENQMGQTVKDYILIPVNVDESTYGFVPVEKYIINGRRYF